MESEMKKKLIEKLLPIIRRTQSLGCYGSTIIGSLKDPFKIVAETCSCSGADRHLHDLKQTEKCTLIKRMCQIIGEAIGKPVHRQFGTYGDFYFEDKNGSIVLAVNGKGEITSSRVYA